MTASRYRAGLLIASALVMSLGMYLYFREVIIPAQQISAAAHNQPHGNNSDLYPRWLAARELLLYHRDPYTQEFTAEIQRGYWGHVLDRNNPDDPKDEAGFAYPLYIVFFLAPTITLNFESVQRLFSVVAVALSVVSVFLWYRGFGDRESVTTKVVAAILMLGSYPVVQALYLQQPVLIVSGLIAGAFAAITSGWLSTAGVLLALAMIKPQSAGPIAAWLLFWSLSRWTSRRALFISFATTIGLLCAGAEFLLPGWIPEWRGAAMSYVQYTEGVPAHVQVIFGRYPGIGVGLILLSVLAVLCWRARHDAASEDRFKLISALILVVNLAVSPIWHEYDQMFVIPAILLIFHWRTEFRRLHAPAQAIVSLCAIAIMWHWVGALALVVMTRMTSNVATKWQILPWLPVFFAPTLVLVSLGLIARSRFSAAGNE